MMYHCELEMKIDSILCVDIGNTRLKWAVCNLVDMCFLESGVMENRNGFAFPVLDSAFGQLQSRPVWVSAVASDDKKQNISDWVDKNWKESVVIIDSDVDEFKHLNGYRDGSTLGVDRWLAMVAAQFYYKNNFCIIDAGTAITVDVVDAAGEHIGGVIMPGKQLMAESLASGTENIDISNGEVVELADSTINGVSSGVLACVVGGIEKVLSVIVEKHSDITVIVTGGDADLIKSALCFEVVLEKNLVLQGVGVMARSDYA